MLVVSIPERVLEALKHKEDNGMEDNGMGFNPWKGFRGFEAENTVSKSQRVTGFNPWKGFRGFEASRLFELLARFSPSCFNPWKGFRGFEATMLYAILVWRCGFNPWKGFRGFEAIVGKSHDRIESLFQSLKGF